MWGQGSKVLLASALNRLPNPEGGMSRLPGPCGDSEGKLPRDTSPGPGIEAGPEQGPLDDIM